SEAEVGDYLALLKPRVMSLVIFTALVVFFIAPGHVHPVIAFTSILCMAFGLILSFFSVLTLCILVNLLAGALLAFTIFFYVVIYTVGLKRWTAQNIV